MSERFTGKPVYRCIGYSNIAIGRVLEEKECNKWLWLRVKWDNDDQWVDEWIKAANCKVLDKKALMERIDKS